MHVKKLESGAFVGAQKCLGKGASPKIGLATPPAY